MGGITTGIGIFSGIDTASLIEQLIQLESRPRALAQIRLTQLQTQQAAYLDINTRLGSLRSAASNFRTNDVFDSARAATSNEDVLTGEASVNAQVGSYTFIVDRLVSTQQQLSRGFSDRDTSGLNAGSFTFETADAELERDVSLADLNGGTGVRRGGIVVTDSAGATATVDLSRAGTLGDVIDAINGSGLGVRAKAVGDGLVIDDTAGGGGTASVADATGSFTASDLGIAGSASGGRITGAAIFRATETTALSLINGGTGIERTSTTGNAAFDFTVRVNGTDARVFLGEIIEAPPEPEDGDEGEDGEETEQEPSIVTPAVSTLGGVIGRINDALQTALGEGTTVSAELNADGTGLRIVDSTGGASIEVLDRGEEAGGTAVQQTAAQLGLAGSGTGAINGSRIFGGLNSTLAKNLNGGSGIGGDGSLTITARDGTVFNVSGLTLDGSLSEITDQIERQTGGVISFAGDERGTGLTLTDASGGTGNLIITGTSGADTAVSLGISTGPTGVAASSIDSGNLQRQYLGKGTLLADLNNGAGLGGGSFTVRDSQGVESTVTISESMRTLGEVIDAINQSAAGINARINDTGDGILIEEADGDIPGSVPIRIRDTSGGVADALNIEGEAEGTDGDNVIDGTFERVVTFEAADTLDDIVTKINNAGVEATASIINDGSGAAPFRLSLTARESGSGGSYIIDDRGFGLGLTSLSEGADARVFFGSGDPAQGLLVTSGTNAVDGLIQGVSIDLSSTSDEPVTLTVSRDEGAIEEAVDGFVSAFNELIGRIDQQSRFVEETEARGPLLGDSTTATLRSRLFSTVLSPGQGLTGRFTRLGDVGITIGDGGNSLSFDTNRFREAFSQDPTAVTALFDTFELEAPDTEVEFAPGITVSGGDAERTFNSLGVVGEIEELARSYLDSVDGILTARENALESQIEIQETRIEDFTGQLDRRREALQAEFIAMERVIGQLQSQQSALASLQIGG
ncbi:MAG: flagellar filament capping protein FliD [Planctomycetota bacterium]